LAKQSFSIEIQYKKGSKIHEKYVQKWLEKTLCDKVNFCGFSSYINGQYLLEPVLVGHLYIDHPVELNADKIKEYVQIPCELFTITDVEKLSGSL